MHSSFQMPRAPTPTCICCRRRRRPQAGAVLEMDRSSFVAANMPNELAVALHGKNTIGKR